MEKVRLKIIGRQQQLPEDAIEVEEIWDAEYAVRGDSHYLLYEEPPGEFSVPARCRIKFKENYLELVKKGPVTTQMFFETGKKNEVYYQTPYGTLQMELDTEAIVIEESPEEIRIQIKYRLVTWDEPISDCHLKLIILRA